MASLILAAAPPAHLRALAPDVLDAPDSARRAAIEATIARRTAAFAPDGAAADLAWPLQPAPDFDPFDYHGTGYFVDHDPRFPGLLQDYTCGTRTYDLDSGYNHAGTDYYLWPYPWLMMDSEQVRIIAAAPGVIVEKIDGNFDRDCAIAGNGGFNAVFVQQDDGLTAWYLHMKNGSQTTKPVGARVEGGEFLGLVGSSGPRSRVRGAGLPARVHGDRRDGGSRPQPPRATRSGAAGSSLTALPASITIIFVYLEPAAGGSRSLGKLP